MGLRETMTATFRVVAALVALIITTAAGATDTIQCEVVGVADGDTLTCLTAERKQIKVRLAQIDAPESGQPYGQASKKALSDLVFRKQITLEPETTDRYGRTVATVRRGDQDINLEMIRRGMAWVYPRYARDPDYFQAHDAAKAARRGLWDDPKAISPEEWRRGKSTGTSAAVVTAAEKSPPSGFQCGKKRFCTEMTSCEEARFHLTQCGLGRLDRDNDGIPCESLCRK